MPNPVLCEICKCWVNKASMFNHARTEEHIKAAAHLNIKNQFEGCGIYVAFGRCKKLSANDILEHFRQFGSIADNPLISLDRGYALIDFNSADNARRALKSSPYIKDEKVSIKPRKKQTPPLFVPKPARIKVGIDGSFEEQALRLLNGLNIPAYPVDPLKNPNLISVISSVHTALKRSFPTNVCFFFGSCVTGIAVPGSDVDIYVNLKIDITKMTPEYKRKAQSDPVKFNEELFEHFVICIDKSRLFTHLLPIPKARTPIVKCFHIQTGIQCDINIKNCLGVANTWMLKYYMDSDIRIKLMIVILKYLMKGKEEINNITSYALSLMVIFYLMQIPDKLAVPAKQLLDTFQPGEPKCYDSYWRIKKTWTSDFRTKNRQPLKDLLFGFFNFIVHYDFGLEFMSVLTGKSEYKWKFTKIETIPDEYNELKIYMAKENQGLQVKNTVCIQDPLELSHNVTRGMSNKNLQDFIKVCQSIIDLSNKKPNICLDDVLNIDTNFSVVWNSKSPSVVYIECSDYFTDKYDFSKVNIQEIWFKNAREVLNDVLALVLCFEQLNSEDEENKIFNVPYVLWSSRKNYIKHMEDSYPNIKSQFNKEVMTSRIMIEASQLDGTFSFWKCEINIKELTSPTRIEISVKDLSNVAQFRSFMSYISQCAKSLVYKGLNDEYKTELQQLPTSQDLKRTGIKPLPVGGKNVKKSVTKNDKSSEEKPELNDQTLNSIKEEVIVENKTDEIMTNGTNEENPCDISLEEIKINCSNNNDEDSDDKTEDAQQVLFNAIEKTIDTNLIRKQYENSEKRKLNCVKQTEINNIPTTSRIPKKSKLNKKSN